MRKTYFFNHKKNFLILISSVMDTIDFHFSLNKIIQNNKNFIFVRDLLKNKKYFIVQIYLINNKI